jgi:hypothetical protein
MPGNGSSKQGTLAKTLLLFQSSDKQLAAGLDRPMLGPHRGVIHRIGKMISNVLTGT